MRFFSVLTAVLVSAFLYGLVIERDQLLAFASGDDIQQGAEAGDEILAQQQRLVQVVALRSTAQTVDTAVILRGQTEAARQVNVVAETAGLVSSEPLRKGASVSEGQLLCRIESGTRQANLAEAEARLAEAQINYTAATRLAQDGFASETRAASARAALQGAEAGVDAANTELSRLELHAPFDGLLESDTAEIGSYLQPGSLCATVIQLDPIDLVGFVPETDVNRVEIGALAGARLATGQEVTGQVTFLSRSADPVTRTFRVEIEVANTDLSIRDGQTAEILIAADGTTAHMLPQSSMTLNDNGDLGVRAVNTDDRVVFMPVVFLRDTVEGVWLGGLPDEVTVIVSGQEFVIDGVAVDVTFRGDDQ